MSIVRDAIASMDQASELKHAYGVAELVLDQLKLPHLLPKLSISFNNRFISVGGDAILKRLSKYDYSSNSFTDEFVGQVRLGTKLFAVAPESEKLQIIVHEVCHIANEYLWYSDSNVRKFKYESHGYYWRKLMSQVGYPGASPYHCIETKQFKTYYLWKCIGCGNKGKLTAQMGGRIINRTARKACPQCRTSVNPNDLTKISGESLVYGETK